MINRGILFWTAVAIATAVGLFLVKYQVQDLEERLAGLNHRIVETQKSAQILRVEWAHLNEIARVERLNEKHLQLQPVAVRQIARLEQIPLRRDPPAGSPPKSNADAPSSTLAGRSPAPAEGGSPTPPSAPPSTVVRSAGPPTPPQQPAIQEPVTAGPAEEGDGRYDSIDEMLSGRPGGAR